MSRLLKPNEKLTAEQRRRVGYFLLHRDRWWLVNERMAQVTDFINGSRGTPIPMGGKVELLEDARILLAKERGGRLCHVQIVSNH